ncbi:hypothetical protein CAPTEDRAFT_204394 [Capitella teleta]|uniref:Uncharacterized protein n=1 Tax=Capitella teleta TaxID=283909 RepID=R7U2K0_CAPTE|nr:hypothetical protein CAPTEDRAFT_204394 [Capitella teleta]|eukprot:ELT97871.1 hypothetical protein CAPTEDRAFT_204394 [Capitella teleta]
MVVSSGRDCVRNGSNRDGEVSSSQTRAGIAWIFQTGDGACGEDAKNGSEIASSRNRIVEQDNERPHSASVTRDFSEDKVSRACSVLTGLLARTVSNRASLGPSNDSDLTPLSTSRNSQNPIAAALEEWWNIPQVIIRPLCDSMRRRCTKYVDARDKHIRY